MPVSMPTNDQLSSIYGSWNPETYIRGDQQAQLANQFANTELQDSQRKLAFDQQADPLRLSEMYLKNQGIKAELPGKQAASDQATRNVQVRNGIPLGLEQQQAVKKIYTDMSTEDLTQTANAIKQGMVHENPEVRRVSEMLYNNLPDQYKANKDEASRERIAAGNNAATVQAAQIGADSRVNIANARAEAQKARDAQNIPNLEKAVVQERMRANEALAKGDRAAYDYHNGEADSYMERLVAVRAAPGQVANSAKPDLSRLPGGGIPTNPVPAAPSYNDPNQSKQPKVLPPGLPPGTKDNGDGTFTLPNGKVVKKKGT